MKCMHKLIRGITLLALALAVGCSEIGIADPEVKQQAWNASYALQFVYEAAGDQSTGERFIDLTLVHLATLERLGKLSKMDLEKLAVIREGLAYLRANLDDEPFVRLMVVALQANVESLGEYIQPGAEDIPDLPGLFNGDADAGTDPEPRDARARDGDEG